VYCTLDAVLDELGVPAGPRNAYLLRLIGQAASRIDGYCGGSLARLAAVEVVSVGRTQRADTRLILRRRPVLAVTSILLTDTGDEVPPVDYAIEDAAAGVIYRAGGWSPGAGTNSGLFGWDEIVSREVRYTISYDAGFDPAGGDPGTPPSPLPADLEGAAIDLVKTWFRAGERDPMVRAEEIEGVGRTEYWVGGAPSSGGSGLPDSITGVLDRYRTVSL
jgi:hypothetical protein